MCIRDSTDYVANKSEQSIVDNTSFIFLRGTHYLDISLSVVNVSNVSFFGVDAGLPREGDAVRVLFSSLVNITWTGCDDVEVRGLTFVLSGRSEEEFSALVFERTNGILSNLTLLGNNSTSRGLFLSDSSYIEFSDVCVSGATSSRGPALYGINSTVDFRGQNSFVNNTATYEGGAIALHNCTSTFLGSNSFQNNTATCGGALFIFGGSHSISGYTSFINNFATLKGGAVSVEGGRYNVSRNILFCLLYTSPSPRDATLSRMPSSA